MTMSESPSQGPSRPAGGAPHVEPAFKGPSVVESGATVNGVPATLDARTFYQLQVYTKVKDLRPLIEEVRASRLEAVVYANVNDPRGAGLLLISEDPETFTGPARELQSGPVFDSMEPLPDFTMLGRTYASGREKNLEDWLLYRARRYALDPANKWAVWYPLRRKGAFSRLPHAEQGKMLGEHAMIGRAYGEAGHAMDIRLECHGLDRDDNEFVLGLVGPRLHPLSKLVKDMRPTKQTSEFIESMGPFFIGRAVYQAPLPEAAKASSDGY